MFSCPGYEKKCSDRGAVRLDWNKGPLALGLRCYRAEEFFEAHEHWEGVWLQSPEPEKTFLQGLIQLTAALHHFQRGNSLGTESLLSEALTKLQGYENFGEIVVAPLCQEISDWLEALRAQSTVPSLPFPQIRRT